jgi:hypothetical protein
MRDYHRAFKPGPGPKPHGDSPRVMRTFRVDVPDDWKELRAVDEDGWVDIPSVRGAEPSCGRLILVKMRDPQGVCYRLLDKEGFDRLVENLKSSDRLAEEMGMKDKGEFFSSIDAVEYHPSGKVRLSSMHLSVLRTASKVELRAVKGELEIRGHPDW